VSVDSRSGDGTRCTGADMSAPPLATRVSKRGRVQTTSDPDQLGPPRDGALISPRLTTAFGDGVPSALHRPQPHSHRHSPTAVPCQIGWEYTIIYSLYTVIHFSDLASVPIEHCSELHDLTEPQCAIGVVAVQ